MSIDQLKQLINFLAPYGFEGLVAALIVFLLIKYFLPGYISEKGKNLATKEDISEITDKIEDVKAYYQSILENLKSKHQLRLAAIDKRLQAHQEAYGLWREINGAIDRDRIEDIVLRCDKWWSKNALYLEPEPRKAFLEAWVSARDLEWYKENSESELVSDCREKIKYAGEALTKAVELPKLNELFDTPRPSELLKSGKNRR
jgi:hypothetical protein